MDNLINTISYDRIKPSNMEERTKLLKQILGKTEESFLIDRDIPSNAVAVGNPCRVIKEIVNEE